MTGESRSLFKRMFVRKPSCIIMQEITEESNSQLERHMNLFDLLCIGIGGTVGTGIFAICGQIASIYAGPSVILCWLFGAIGCILSSAAYVELSTRMPTSGSAYAYCYYALGEVPALVAAWCLMLEYGFSASAVARNWGSKFYLWLIKLDVDKKYIGPLDYRYCSIFSGFMLTACVVLLGVGVSLGKYAVNIITTTKIMIVLFMIIGGLINYNSDHLKDGFPPPVNATGVQDGYIGGWNGVLLGSTQAFFGYIGFDEVCCLGAEAKNPSKTLPRAVIGTVLGTAVLSSTAGFALVGMQQWQNISGDEGFGGAFDSVGWPVASQIVRIGEICTLPVVVLVSFLAQPRLQYALAMDGLLPRVFAKTNKNGNLVHGIVIGGMVCLVFALVVPFTPLSDLISAGILISFCLTNSSLIMIRRSAKSLEWTPKVLVAYWIACMISTLFLFKMPMDSVVEWFFGCVLIIATGGIAIVMAFTCPEGELPDALPPAYLAPMVPALPCLAIFVNWCFIAQLSWQGLVQTGGWIVFAIGTWFVYGSRNSRLSCEREPLILKSLQES